MIEKGNILAGITPRGEKVTFVNNPINDHLIVTGTSGIGKSTYMYYLMIAYVLAGKTVIALNWKNCINHEAMPEVLRKEYEKHAIVYDAVKGGIPLPLFTLKVNQNGEEEPERNLFQRVTDMFTTACGLTKTQRARLLPVVRNYFKENSYKEQGIGALPNSLEQGKATEISTAGQICKICSNNVFRDGNLIDYSNPSLIEINLNSLERESQEATFNFIVDYLGRLSARGNFTDYNIALFIDEANMIDFSLSLTELLTIARKTGLELKIATTTIKTKGKDNMNAMKQANYQIYFKPDDNSEKDVLKWIGGIDYVIRETFRKFNRGDFIAKGEFLINGKPSKGSVRMKAPSEEDLANIILEMTEAETPYVDEE